MISGLAAIWARARCAVGRRLRRRGTFLLMFGAIYGAYGIAIATDPLTPFASLGPFGAALSTAWWGALWIGCAIAAIGVAIRRHVMSDVIGYNALLIPPAIWSLAYTWAWVLWVGSGGTFGSARAWAAAVIWSSAVVTVLIVAGWPEPPREGEEC